MQHSKIKKSFGVKQKSKSLLSSRQSKVLLSPRKPYVTHRISTSKRTSFTPHLKLNSFTSQFPIKQFNSSNKQLSLQMKLHSNISQRHFSTTDPQQNQLQQQLENLTLLQEKQVELLISVIETQQSQQQQITHLSNNIDKLVKYSKQQREKEKEKQLQNEFESQYGVSLSSSTPTTTTTSPPSKGKSKQPQPHEILNQLLQQMQTDIEQISTEVGHLLKTLYPPSNHAIKSAYISWKAQKRAYVQKMQLERAQEEQQQSTADSAKHGNDMLNFDNLPHHNFTSKSSPTTASSSSSTSSSQTISPPSSPSATFDIPEIDLNSQSNTKM